MTRKEKTILFLCNLPGWIISVLCLGYMIWYPMNYELHSGLAALGIALAIYMFCSLTRTMYYIIFTNKFKKI